MVSYMKTTVLESLQNAQANFETVKRMGVNVPIYDLALEQLKNGVEALEDNMGPDDIIQETAFGETKTTK